MIPKIFHFNWPSHKLIPTILAQCVFGWLEKHPGWQVYVWGDEGIPNMINAPLIKSQKWKRDFIGVEVLYRYGGVCLDVDITCVRPIPEWIMNTGCWIAGEMPGHPGQPDPQLSNAAMGAEPGHPFLKFMIEKWPDWLAEMSGWHQVRLTGPECFSWNQERYAQTGGPPVTILPSDFFHPGQTGTHLHTENTIGDHHWFQSWKEDCGGDRPHW